MKGHGRHGGWDRIRHELSHLNPFGHSHESSDSVDDALESSEVGIWALKVSLAVLMATALFQVVIVAFSGSVALLADTIHNFSDALTAVPLWIAFALSRRAANRAYTYGYGRAEDLAGVAIVVMIFFSAVVAGYQSVVKLIYGSEVSNVGWVAAAAVIGFLGNEFVAQFRVSVGRRIGSAALVADGQHARVDGFTSLAVLVGAVGVWLGYPILDPLVGLGITLAILFIVKDSARSMWRRMMDAIEPETVEAIERVARDTDGVQAVDFVRARWVGHRIYSEARVRVSDSLSVAEGREISQSIRASARREVPKLERITVEVEPASG
ncbi:MAG: cation diffusion facilitator family transporter [Rubrobacteraceae bacterium]